MGKGQRENCTDAVGGMQQMCMVGAVSIKLQKQTNQLMYCGNQTVLIQDSRHQGKGGEKRGRLKRTQKREGRFKFMVWWYINGQQRACCCMREKEICKKNAVQNLQCLGGKPPQAHSLPIHSITSRCCL